MRNLWLGALTAPLLMTGLAFGADKIDKLGDDSTCGSHGTSIDFVDTPNDAARKARKEGKLVLILHVSGNFEDPRFT